ncbi:hypothetical protein [Kangiella spongicola]|uniref:Uncharacterized protein n=1 Tax=Kangiella spongicola TaxID=796379 RepID=A0A318D8T1_9GAMM|nr:hypothetical protein [Kangiella spongicola]PXF62529.1 hypothetical protein DL796_09305 [Kangiella spongicola]
MKIKNIVNSELWKFIKEHWGLLISLITGVLFIAGYISARFYFSYWNVPYTEISNSLSPFEFSLQKPEVLFYSIAVGMMLIILSAVTFSDPENDDIRKWRTHLKNPVTYIVVLGPVMVGFIWLFVTPNNSKDQIKNRAYIPYEVIASDSNGSYRCVHILASIASYLVLIGEDLQPVLIKESSVLSIKTMMQPYPVEEITRGRSSFVNKNYKMEKSIWDKHWERVCYSEIQYSFKNFNFNKTGPER